MTDKEKLEAVRAEIHRLVDVRGYDREMANDLFAFMDSLPNEPVSDLEEAAKHYLCSNILYDDVYVGNPTDKDCIEMFKAGANWQEEKDNEEKVLIYKHGFDDCKEQMIKDALDAVVKIDAGGYPYIPQMELYDYDKDIPLAKEGDKYKVILIKED